MFLNDMLEVTVSRTYYVLDVLDSCRNFGSIAICRYVSHEYMQAGIETVGVNDLSCSEHIEQSTSVTEIMMWRNLTVSTWVKA